MDCDYVIDVVAGSKACIAEYSVIQAQARPIYITALCQCQCQSKIFNVARIAELLRKKCIWAYIHGVGEKGEKKVEAGKERKRVGEKKRGRKEV